MSDSDENGAGVPLLEPLSPSASPPLALLKRKREDGSQSKSKGSVKRKKAKKPRDVDDVDLDGIHGINTSLGRMDSRLLADHIAQRTKRFENDLSLVELEDRYIPEKAILDTSEWEQPRTLENLPAFLKYFVDEDLSISPKTKGSPHTLVVASAGLRAADLTRSLRKFQTKDSTVAKLFAKHIKLKEAVESCKKTRMSIGVGTPQRLADLLDDGALSSQALKRVIVDASHIDQKKRGILDMKETQVPLVRLLTRTELKSRYGVSGKKIEIIFY